MVSANLLLLPSSAHYRRMISRKLLPVVASLALAVLGAGAAQADPVQPDPDQPPNGLSAPAYPTDPLLTGVVSPVQVPAPRVTTTEGSTQITAYPFLAPWVHNAVPIDPNSAVEISGAARVTLPNPATGGTITVNPNGHCLFEGANFEQPNSDSTALQPVVVDVPGFGLTIEPSLHGNLN
ncbi:hypothetical protein JGU71_25685 [Antrihabitans sp. YC3-6]|uniref:Uncharacterized protein n=1 Tax=Antrihabitans stalagmiti TaxID=2799499 RepID=A0A934U6U1_9NOCA|nr:hypothetical protein [Antrihabitans stalagmiti]MBJ8342288.1 hypothetical protein [Antrihabitans stalagmiti]